MKRLIWIFCCFILTVPVYGQYYLRGEIRDNKGHFLEGVKILLSSHGTIPFFSGNSGSFGIPVNAITDSISLSIDGYEPIQKKWIDTRQFLSIHLQMLPATAQSYQHKLASATTNLKASSNTALSVLGESYRSLVENSFVDAEKYPETGFSLNIDKASYSNIRRFITNEMHVPVDAIRIEEMLNYFSFSADNSQSVKKEFSCQTKLSSCPWDENHQLLFLNLSAPRLNLDSIPASNLVFLIDISGSMDKPNRLPLLQSAFKLLVDNLREKDTITVVTYGGSVSIALAPTSGGQKQRIKEVIDSLAASGDTPGESAIRIAYDLAKRSFIPKGNNRVILATDGDFNIGQTTEKELEDMISGFRQTGIYLTCLGVGMGNYKDSKLEVLSKKGKGNFAYIDNLAEAQKVLVTEFTQTLYSVADNAYLKINFNPATVKEYRLIGFDNKRNDMEDSTSQLEGGEIGSGQSMMALFEITPVEKEKHLQNPKLADIKLNYKMPKTGIDLNQSFTAPFTPEDIEMIPPVYRFAASVAMFGLVLKQSAYIQNYQLEDVLQLARGSLDTNDPLQNDFIYLIEKAIKMAHPPKQRRKKSEN